MDSDNNKDKSKSNTFSTYFATAVKNLKQKSVYLLNFTWRQPKALASRTGKLFEFKYVSKLFVEKQLRTFKKNKATGLDNLPPRLLKDSASKLSKPLCHIINLSINTLFLFRCCGNWLE